MRYFFDTNILLVYLRKEPVVSLIENQFSPFSSKNVPIISVVSIGEMESLALRNDWGTKRKKLLDDFFDQFIVSDIHAKEVIQNYAEIEAYSQNKHPLKKRMGSSITMGKNDLWIAASASVLDATLLTMDKDFVHLNGEFLKVELIER